MVTIIANEVSCRRDAKEVEGVLESGVWKQFKPGDEIVVSSKDDEAIIKAVTIENDLKVNSMFAFVKYGDHVYGCPKRSFNNKECNCGFDETLKIIVG